MTILKNKKSSNQAHIEIAIDAQGNIAVETVGTTGKECDYLVGELEKNLGSVVARINKDTYLNKPIK